MQGNATRSIWFLIFASLAAGCAPLARVNNVRPAPPAGAFAQTEFPTGRETRRTPAQALSREVSISEIAWRRLRRNPNDDAARQVYNYAVGRTVSLLQTNGKLPDAGHTTIGSDGDARRLTFVSDLRFFSDPRTTSFVPADELEVRGVFFARRIRRPGIGAPVLAQSSNALELYREGRLHSDKLDYAMTALLDFRGHEVRLVLKDPLAFDQVRLGDRIFPLAADFSIGPAMLLTRFRPQRLGLIRMLRPERYAHTARLIRLQPYDPRRIPVVFVHGLRDTPASWAPVINGLRADPAINRNYQLWVFSYPSGYPFPYSADLLRSELDRIDQTYPDHSPIVLVGHSMGGLISRLMVTNSGYYIWDAYFKKRPAELPMNPADKQKVEALLLFHSRPDVGRVIFVATPHRGSGLAANIIGRIAIMLVSLPERMVSLGVETAKFLVNPGDSARKPRFPTSIDTLAPTNRFLVALNKLPIDPRVLYHSIIADRGRGDSPNSSDGVVPYWSSHLAGAQSEKIVPAGHAALNNQQTIGEIQRILLLNSRTQQGPERRVASCQAP